MFGQRASVGLQLCSCWFVRTVLLVASLLYSSPLLHVDNCRRRPARMILWFAGCLFALSQLFTTLLSK